MAYQIAFDMYDSATQQFLNRVQTTLRAGAPVPIAVEKTPQKSSAEDKDKDKDTSERWARLFQQVCDLTHVSVYFPPGSSCFLCTGI